MSTGRPVRSDLVWSAGETPSSRHYGDVYFSKQGGLAESRTVFLDGCGLPGAWSGRDAFCVAELGLGAGRNLAALLDLWARTRPVAARLSIFSVEAHPMAAEDAARALAPWPQVAEAARLITSRWPTSARGFHRIELPEFAATLDVAVMEALDALQAWSGAADAWFLDGFSPTRNPQMWRSELMALVRARSAPGARVATYSAARAVRDSLASQGFAVQRAAGFGAKRHRLHGSLPDARAAARANPSVAIVGAGIAGAALRRAFSALGVDAIVFDARGLGGGASGGAAALVAPRLDAGLGTAAELFAQAARRAGEVYRALPAALISSGAIQLAVGVKDEKRFSAIAGSPLFAPGAMRLLAAGGVASLLEEAAADAGLLMRDAMVVSPQEILGAWLAAPPRRRIAGLDKGPRGWRLLDEDGALACECDVVCLAAGTASAALAPGLQLLPVGGQVTQVRGRSWPIATLFGGYVIPTRQGLLFGATHQRGRQEATVRTTDDAENLASLRKVLPRLADRLAGETLTGWAGVRATTTDFLPLAGQVSGTQDGLFVLSGLGSRGFCLAPLLAEHIAAMALGGPSPLPSQAANLVWPGRFSERARRKGRLAPVAERTTP
ncbi:MAG TPA: tRNA (5-methylaminomethyl-2-thiouridine)(34)-methyltransferase MnmD [Caulobacteraceae bacterium]